MGKLLLVLGESDSFGYVPRVNGDCSGVTRRVAIPSIERCHQCRGKRKIRSLELARSRALFLVEPIEPLGGENRAEEKEHAPNRQLVVCVSEQGDQGRVER